MLETFKARLKAKILTLGVNNLTTQRLDTIAARLHKKFPDLTEEKDHDTQIDLLHELTPLDELAKQDDRIRTLEAKTKGNEGQQNNNQQSQQQSSGTEGNQQQQNKDDKAQTGDETAVLLKTLLQEVQTLKKEKTHETITGKISAHDKLKGIPADFWNKRVIPEKEEDIENFVADVETGWTAVKQKLADEGFAQVTKPVLGDQKNGKDKQEKVSSEMQSYLAEKKAATQTQQTQKTS